MENIKEIQRLFNLVLQQSQDQYVQKVNTDQIFTEWETNKDWFKSATNSLIWEWPEPVTFNLDEESRRSKVDEFIDWVYREYGEDMYYFFKNNYDAILENKLQTPYKEFPAGMKLSKVLMREFGLQAEDVRQKLSMLIQANKVTGKLCLSIHPLDYLSASENNHGWRSCHAMDGEYRVGNVSYMTDSCTIMAYLRSDTSKTKLPRFPHEVPWNDKKWRCYLHVDRENEIVYAGRQYPFFTETGLRYISAMLHDLAYFMSPAEKKKLLDDVNDASFHLFRRPSKPITWDQYLDNYIPRYSFQPVGLKGEVNINGHYWSFDETKLIVGYGSNRRIVPVTKYMETDKDACCFNDVIQSHTYSPWILNYKEEDHGCMPLAVEHKLIVGHGVNCICCGKRPVSDSDNFFCVECRDDEKECCRCGCIDNEHSMHYVDGQWYCDSCYDDCFYD